MPRPTPFLDILSPTLGVYTDRPAYTVPLRGLQGARNVRIRNGCVCRELMGWDPFGPQLNGPVLLIDTFRTRAGSRNLIFGTPTDLYSYNGSTGAVSYITPRYETGTATRISGLTAVGGTGTSWSANVKAGDEIHFGAAGETDPDAEWHEIDSVTSNTVLELVSAAAVNSSGAYTIRKKFTGTRLDPWIPATYYGAPPPDTDLWFATNGVDAPVAWDGNDDQVRLLTALNLTCRWLLAFQGMMLYGNILESGTRRADVVRFSAVGDPENVTTAGAGEVNATTASDIINGARVLGDFVVTYGEFGSLNLLQFVGPPVYFVIRTVSLRHGAVSSRSILDAGDYHEALTHEGVYRFDGATQSFVGEQVFRDAVRQLDPNRHPQALAYMDRENGEVQWVVPLVSDGVTATASPVTSYQEFYREPVGKFPTPFVPRDLPATALGEYERDDTLRFSDLVAAFQDYGHRWNDRFLQATFPQKLMGTADGTIYTLFSSDAQDGAPFTAFARLGRIPLGDGTVRGFLGRIELAAAPIPGATHALTVECRGADRPESAGVVRSTETYDLSEGGPRWIAPHVLDRFLDIELRTSGANESWSVSGVRLYPQPAGEQ